MLSAPHFDEALDAVERLSPDEQAELIEVVRQRLAEQGRQRIVDDAREARTEFEQGLTKTGSVDDLMREIAS